MSAHRRSLLTAAAAGAVLFALWFVPSARATPETAPASAPVGAAETVRPASAPGQADRSQEREHRSGDASSPGAEGRSGAAADAGSGSASEGPDPDSVSGPGTDSASASAREPRLADTGGFASAPYLLGGIGLLGAGGALVLRSPRRPHPGTGPGNRSY